MQEVSLYWQIAENLKSITNMHYLRANPVSIKKSDLHNYQIKSTNQNFILAPYQAVNSSNHAIYPILLHTVVERGKLKINSHQPYPWIPLDLLEPFNSNYLSIANYFDIDNYYALYPITEVSLLNCITYAKDLLDRLSNGNWERYLNNHGYHLTDNSAIANWQFRTKEVTEIYHHQACSINTRDFINFIAAPTKVNLNDEQLSILSSSQCLKDNEIILVNALRKTGKTLLINTIIANLSAKQTMANMLPSGVNLLTNENQIKTITLFDLPSKHNWLSINDLHNITEQTIDKFLLNFNILYSKKYTSLAEVINYLWLNLQEKYQAYISICEASQAILKLVNKHDLCVTVDKVYFNKYKEYNKQLTDLYAEIDALYTFKQLYNNLKSKYKFNFKRKQQEFAAKYLPHIEQDVEIYLENRQQEIKTQIEILKDKIDETKQPINQCRRILKQYKQIYSQHFQVFISPIDVANYLSDLFRCDIYYITLHYWQAKILNKEQLLSDLPGPELLIIEHAELLLPTTYEFVAKHNKVIAFGHNHNLRLNLQHSVIDQYIATSSNVDIDSEKFNCGVLLSNSTLYDYMINYLELPIHTNLSNKKNHSNEIITLQSNLLSNYPKQIICSKRLLPTIGILDISSNSNEYCSGRINFHEANSIVNWLYNNKDCLEATYDTSLANIVKVCTTFKSQKLLITDKLAEFNINLKAINIIQQSSLTIYPLIIFSPVYAPNDPKPYIFDENYTYFYNLLEQVRDSLLIFANKRLFMQAKHMPSAKIASIIQPIPTLIADNILTL